MGCDFRWLNVVRCLNWFQSTHPHGVRQNLRSKVIDVLEFQSTHPHGVRQYNLQQLPTLQAFQSTHPHGVRLFAPEKVKQDAEFQSTHPHGVRPYPVERKLTKWEVSIHAPTWGATDQRQKRLGAE